MINNKNITKYLERRKYKLISVIQKGNKIIYCCEDDLGYKYSCSYSNLANKKSSYICRKSNIFSIQNIQHFLNINKLNFEILSKEYVSNNSNLRFMCKRCGKIIENKWININRPTSIKHGRLMCSNCDGTTESYHAIALKQMFLKEYPDTIVEERSCINPNTLKAMPTDIVNHRLKIAIEIQSQWHDFKKERDLFKKNFWINKGYSFYDPDIRNYSILELCKLFFNISKLPDYINFSQANKIDINKIQNMLNNGMVVVDIAKELNIDKHRIYDALGSNKLQYPKTTN